MKVLLLTPSSRVEAFSNLGLQFVYTFTKNLGHEIDLITTDIEKYPLFSNYDLIFVSLGFENALLDLPEMFKKGGMNSKRSEQGDRGFPPVIAGGNLAFINPLPFVKYVDVVACGEGEILLPIIFEKYSEAKSKNEFFEMLGASEYFIYKNSKAARAYVRRLDNPLVSEKEFESESVYKNTKLIEISRGCGRGCKFCVAGEVYKPLRFAPFEKISEIINREVLNNNENKKFGLMGTAVGDHPKLLEILKLINHHKAEVSLSSIRSETLTDEMLYYIKEGGAKSFTIAPEAGNDKLRNFIGKTMKNEDVLKVAEMAAKTNFNSLKLYFIVGLPNESQDDILSIGNLIRQIKTKFNRQVAVTINPFVPKPWTAFETFQMLEVKELKEKIQILKKDLIKIKGLDVRDESPKMSYLQWALACGDENIIDDVLNKNVKRENIINYQLQLNWKNLFKHSIQK